MGAPTTKAKGSWGGREHRKSKIYSDVLPKWVNSTPKKSVNMGHILTTMHQKKYKVIIAQVKIEGIFYIINVDRFPVSKPEK